MNQRELALKIIYKTISDNSYTNLLMRNELNKLPKESRPFVTNLVNGVLKNYDYLLYQHQDLYQKASPRVKIILSMAVYERFYLKKEEYIVNNEYVNLGENEFEKSFINAILHKIDSFKQSDDDSIKYSIPKWILNLLKKQYDNSDYQKILRNYTRVPKTYYRLNKKKVSFDDLKHLDINIINNSIFTSSNNLVSTDEFNNGLFYIQDINASSLVDEFDLNENDLYLDACSAPGSKLFNALDIVKPSNAYGNDVNEKRVNLIKEKAEILGFKGVNYLNFDASKLSEHLNIKFDKILLDVPCSGLGVIGRKNDIKFHIKPESLDELQTLQKDILEDVSSLLKDGGELIYSTCTLNRKENDKQIEKFLNSHENFKLLKYRTIINEDGDMFYFAKIKKV